MVGGIQQAVKDGAKEIILLGCDVDYHVGNDNHCSPDYTEPSAYSDPVVVGLRNDTLLDAHKVAKKMTDSLGVRVYNATPGGNLEVYPRIGLKEIL